MSYDLLIKNGTVVDGLGTARRRADVAVANGKIAAIGKVTDSARKTIDAGDLIVAPGFVDPHTHYDAQICWDPVLSSSSLHGVTSVVMGNCGVGLAPCKPNVREIAAWDLVNVEAIPFEVLGKGIKWEWETFPEYMQAAQKRGSGVNLGFLAPLTTSGRMWLMPVDSRARDDGYALYGWTDADLGKVNAACSDNVSPAYRDPLNPGILVKETEGHYVLTIAGSNHRYRPGWYANGEYS